jgi:hypothetical protein
LLGSLLVDNVWFSLALWSGLYVSDYVLTLWAARLYQADAKSHVVLKGSLEITPYFQQDVDALKPLSTRFIRALLFSGLTIALAWLLAVRLAGLPQAFSLLVGALILLEATAHIRHVRNIVFLKTLRDLHTLKGQIEYPRWLSLKLSSVEILGFAALFLLAFAVTGDWFFLGGVASCLLTGLKHLDWAGKAGRDHRSGAANSTSRVEAAGQESTGD